MQDAKVSGTVLDISGNPLSGVSVTTGTEKVTTGSDGVFTFTQAGTVNDRAVFKLEKAGYFTLTRSCDVRDVMHIEAILCHKGNSEISAQADFDASAENTIEAGGLKIELPAKCIVKTDGSAYSGTVRADVLFIGPRDGKTVLMMPGGDLATSKTGEMMNPVGIADVTLTDGAGNLLKIKEKSEVRITYPVPSDVIDASIPLWTFDEARGVWKQEGSVTRQGNVYIGGVSHFTYWGTGTVWPID
ncbi:MAG: carboxypeptidase-like regulatory domain-containing protein, partial [Clostridiales bacterium]|nr:carboxypeptidase-like regulatory domain-containing protein [Clostridiales bacterium]